MKVIVLREYEDKYTKDFHKEGELIDMTKERFREIIGASTSPFVKEVKEVKKSEEVGD